MLIATSLLVSAQPQIKFTETEHDYGTINEDDGLAETVFEFVNTGSQPLILNNVKATCGCTTPEWTKNPVAPSQKGTIKVSYNPQNRPGAFTKNVNVYSNTSQAVTVLAIKGSVVPHEKTVEEIYPREMGPIRLKSNYISIGNLYTDEVKTSELEIINTSDVTASLGIFKSPDCVDVKFEPEELNPGEKGKIALTYNAAKRNAFGSVSDRVYLTINDEKQNTFVINVMALLQENFSKMTADQLANAPVASFDTKVFDFGSINQGDKASHNFKLTNNGRTDLILRDVKSSCGCTAVKHANLIKPGETIDLAVEFNSSGKRNKQNKSVTITTNDPKNSTIQLRITGTVL